MSKWGKLSSILKFVIDIFYSIYGFLWILIKILLFFINIIFFNVRNCYIFLLLKNTNQCSPTLIILIKTVNFFPADRNSSVAVWFVDI